MKQVRCALGLIETMGYGVAITATDAALKAAHVTVVKLEECIGSGGSLGVTVYLKGEVAAVQAAVDAGVEAAKKIGKVVAVHVIANLDEKVKTGMFHSTLEL